MAEVKECEADAKECQESPELDELFKDVNSLCELEEGECTPSEIHIPSEPHEIDPHDDLDYSFDWDDLNEGDDENSDFEITVVDLASNAQRLSPEAEGSSSSSSTKDPPSSPLHCPIATSFKPTSPVHHQNPGSPQQAHHSASDAAAVAEPEVSRDSSAAPVSPVNCRPTSSLTVVDEVFCSSSSNVAASAGAAKAASSLFPAPTSTSTTPSPSSPKRSQTSVFDSDSQAGLPNFTSTPISLKDSGGPRQQQQQHQQQQQQRKRIPFLFQSSSQETTSEKSAFPFPTADGGETREGGDENDDDDGDDDVTLKPSKADRVNGDCASPGPSSSKGVEKNAEKNDDDENDDDRKEKEEEDGYSSSILDGYNDKDNRDKDNQEEEDGYGSSIMEGYNDDGGGKGVGSGAEYVKSDEEVMEDNLLYGDLGLGTFGGGGDNNNGFGDNGVNGLQFDFPDDEFDEISRRLLGDDADLELDDDDDDDDDEVDGGSQEPPPSTSRFDDAASPPLKRRRQEPLSPIPTSTSTTFPQGSYSSTTSTTTTWDDAAAAKNHHKKVDSQGDFDVTVNDDDNNNNGEMMSLNNREDGKTATSTSEPTSIINNNNNNNNNNKHNNNNKINNADVQENSLANLIVIDESGDDKEETTIVLGDDSDKASDVICLGAATRAVVEGDDDGDKKKSEAVPVDTEGKNEALKSCLDDREEDAANDDDAANRSMEALSEAESVGILVEDLLADDAQPDDPVSSASASASSSASSLGDEMTLKRKADSDSGFNSQVDLVSGETSASASVSASATETPSKGPKIKRVVEVKGDFRWDVFKDSHFAKEFFDRDSSLEEMKQYLSCSLGGDRLVEPVRAKHCSHLEPLDRKNVFIFKNVSIGDPDCPLCGARGGRKGVIGTDSDDLDDDGLVFEKSELFSDVLEKTDYNAVIFYRDGTWGADGASGVAVKSDEGDDEEKEAKSQSINAEMIPPDESGPKVIQIYDKHGDKKTVKIENEDQMMRLVGEKWELESFPKRDKNRTVSNFRKRRLKKDGQLLVGRALLERNESPLYRSNDDDGENGGEQRPRRGRKRQRTVEEMNFDKTVLSSKYYEGVMERKLEDLAKDYERTKQQHKQIYEQQKMQRQQMQVNEIKIQDHRCRMECRPRDYMYELGRMMKLKHTSEMEEMERWFGRKTADFDHMYECRRRETENEVRRDIQRITQMGVPSRHKADISGRGEDVEDIVPAVLCGGNDKKVKTTFLPIDCVEAILKEDEAYRQVYGMDDKVVPRGNF